MATVSTIPAVKAQLVSKIRTALATSSQDGGQVQTSYAWPGPDSEHESVFLGRHPELDDIRVDANHQIPTLKAGRKQRQESYSIPVTVFVFRPDLSPDGAQTCETQGFSILDDIEDVLADDPQIGLTSIQWATAGDIQALLWPFQSGWASEIVLSVNVEARLT